MAGDKGTVPAVYYSETVKGRPDYKHTRDQQPAATAAAAAADVSQYSSLLVYWYTVQPRGLLLL